MSRRHAPAHAAKPAPLFAATMWLAAVVWLAAMAWLLPAPPAWAIEPAAVSAGPQTRTTMNVHNAQDKQQGIDGARQDAEKLRASLATPDLKLLDVQPFGAGYVQHWQLANGLRVLLAPDPVVPVVAVHTWLRVGSAWEVPGHTGLAHLLEHLMFKSTKTRPAGTFDRVLEQMGASANAATWLDWTYYHETVPPQHVVEVLELEADRLTHLDLTPLAFKSELAVVKNERREHVDNDADGLLDEALHAQIYGNHPYGHPIIGTAADLESVTLPDVQAFYKAHYAPDRAVLVLAGDIDPSKLMPEIVRLYGHLAAAGTRTEPKAVKLPEKASQVAMTVDAGAARLAVAWRTPAGDHPDHAALAVLAEALWNADSARLQRRLLHGKPLAADVHAHLTETRGPGLLDLRVVLLPGLTAKDALAVLDAGLAELAEHPPTEQELQGARNRLRMHHLRELTGVDGRAEALGLALATFGDPGHHARWWQAVEMVTVADLQRVANTWLLAGRRVVVLGEVEKPVTKARKSRKPAA